MNHPPFGARVIAGSVSFRLWAPAARQVDLVLDQPQPMRRADDGWFSLDVNGLAAGVHYKFRIDGETDVPDPASSFQPDDVFGPSEVIDHASYQWKSAGWRGRPWEEAVLIETHVGTFTDEGTYRAVIERLDHLVDTGITALELMPIADFAGQRNWGYDGVLWYAPDGAYGRPEDLKALIDAAHQRGLMVFLDVVYNHFGPEGNFLHRYAPTFFTAAATPWGSVIDYSLPEVRAFAVNSALSWLRDYRFDGLRFDAVNHIVTPPGGISMLHDLSIAAGKLAAETGRHIHLVLENGDNIASLLDPAEAPPRGKFRAQWNDDYHHAFHVLLTGESQGYYGDYQRSPRGHIARALASGFVYQGEVAAFWGNRPRGEPSGALSPTAFVSFLQNHDQTGNRALGERLDSLADPKQIRAALAITLLAPMVPMLFMGEEWGSQRPFLFFCDFAGDLADAVRKGRRREYDWAYARYGDSVPDPLDPTTFQACVLDWEARDAALGHDRLALVRGLLEVRRREIVPRLAGARHGDAQATDDGLLTAHWQMGDGTSLRLAANLSADEIALHPDQMAGAAVWGSEGDRLPAWSVCWRLVSGEMSD
jgi:maltooligosyltrehalose trehalohydrolase